MRSASKSAALGRYVCDASSVAPLDRILTATVQFATCVTQTRVSKACPYLLIQQQFEFFNAGRCHIATHDEDYAGDFPLKLKELSPTFLAFEIGRKNKNLVQVSFALDASEFEEVRRIVEIIFGLREPDSDHDVL